MTGYSVRPHEGRLPEAVPSTLRLYQSASAIVCHDPAGIPPMLETGETAAACLRALLADDAAVGEHAEVRCQYRSLISAVRGPDCVSFLHESGLRRLRGDKHLRHAQFLVLAMLRDEERVQVRVVPEVLEYLVPRDAFSIVRCPDGREVVVVPLRTATLVLDGEEHLAAYRDLVATLDNAALSPADSVALIMGLSILPEPMSPTAKEFADDATHAPVTQRSGPVQECFRAILRALADADGHLTPEQISSATGIPRANATGYVQVLLRDSMVTAMRGRHAPDGTIQEAPGRSYTVTAQGMAYLHADNVSGVMGSGRGSAGYQPIAQRSNFFQDQLRDILWVLDEAGGYQTIEEIADATAFWEEQAGHRLGVLLREKMVALMVGHYARQGLPVRDSRVKSYTITSAGLEYLGAAPPGESRELSIATRRVERELPKSERHRAVRLRMNAADPRPARGTTSHTPATSLTTGQVTSVQGPKDAD